MSEQSSAMSCHYKAIIGMHFSHELSNGYYFSFLMNSVVTNTFCVIVFIRQKEELVAYYNNIGNISVL